MHAVHEGALALPPGWWRTGLRPGEADTAPAWAAVVERAVRLADGLEPFAGTAPAGVRCLEPALAPLLAAARELLPVRARAVPPQVAAAALHDALGPRLATTAARTLVRRMHVAREAGELDAADPAGRFARFVTATASGAGLAALVRDHPVLARLLGQSCVQEAAAVAELAAHLDADRAAVVADLLDGHDPGPVTALRCGLGDRHGGGRSVAAVHFASGARVIHKPRHVALHRTYADLVAWLGAAAPDVDLRAVRSVDRGDHGWTEYVSPAPCRTTADVARFYRRQGALLALLHAVDGTDAHCENIVACGDQPVLIDVETLFHPDLAAARSPDPALRALTGSVDRVCLLPRRIFGGSSAPDLSGLGGAAGQALPDDAVSWAGSGTDEMALVRVPRRFAGAANRPTLHGEPVGPRRFRDDLVGGFRAAYDALAAGAGDLLDARGALRAAAGVPTRVVVRDSGAYGRLLDEGTHPDLLADTTGLLFTGLPPAPGADVLLPHELRDLWDGDVPLFSGRPGSRDLWTARGERVPDVLGRTVLETTAERLTAMGPADREHQEWVIAAALSLVDAPTVHSGGPAGRGPAAVPPDPQRLVAAACGIADRLAASAHHGGDRVNWIGLELLDDRWWSVLPLGAGLAAGHPGVALFLAQLGAVTGIGRYGDLARRAVAGLPAAVEALAGTPEAVHGIGCGGFHGFGGIAYALARLATLLDDDRLAAAVPAAVGATLTAGVAAPQDRTVGTGLAGAVAALRAVHAQGGQTTAAQAADRLAGLDPPPAGGTGGGFLAGADGERWAGLAGTPTDRDPGPDAGDPGWCRGTAGRLLARAPDPAAVRALAIGAPLADHGLCHGELGVLDALTSLGADRDPVTRRALSRRTGRLLAALEQDGPRLTTPAGLAAPALLTGLAGVGYGLLRLAHPTTVPSVLLLAPAPSPVPAGCPAGPSVRPPEEP